MPRRKLLIRRPLFKQQMTPSINARKKVDDIDRKLLRLRKEKEQVDRAVDKQWNKLMDSDFDMEKENDPRFRDSESWKGKNDGFDFDAIDRLEKHSDRLREIILKINANRKVIGQTAFARSRGVKGAIRAVVSWPAYRRLVNYRNYQRALLELDEMDLLREYSRANMSDEHRWRLAKLNRRESKNRNIVKTYLHSNSKRLASHTSAQK